MGLRFLACAWSAEWRRTVSRPAAWWALAPLPLAGGLAALAFCSGSWGGGWGSPGAADVAALRGMQTLTATFWPLLPLLFAALSLSQERQAGILALLAAGPLPRWALLGAKALAALAFLLVGGLLLTVGAGVAAHVAGGGLTRPGVLAAAALGCSLSLAPVAGLGLLCGAAARGPGQAGLAALGLHLLLDTLGGALAATRGAPYLLYTGGWGLPFERAAEALAGLPSGSLPLAAALSWAAWSLAPLALALFVFSRRDLA